MTKASATFLRVPEPHGDESLAGFMLRLAEKNYYDTPRWVYQLAGLAKYNSTVNANLLDPSSVELYQLYELTGIELGVLWSLAFPPMYYQGNYGNYLDAFGQAIPRFAVHQQKAKICPLCLEEAEYCRKVWDMAAVTACPLHKCFLVDECPNCGRSINWSRTSVAKCRCGFDWRESPLSPVVEEELDLSKQVHLLCGLPAGEKDVGFSRRISLLKNLDLEQLNVLVFFLAGQFAQRRGKWRILTRASLRNNKLHELLIKACEVFRDWPKSFYDYLDFYRSSKVPHKRATGIESDFGHFYKSLYQNFSYSAFDFIRRAFEQYLAEKWDGGYINTKQNVGAVINTRKSFLSGVEAGSRLGINAKQVKKLIDEGHLEGQVKQMGSRKMVLVKENSVAAFKKVLESALSVKEAADILGIGHESVVDLVKKGCIKALRGPLADGYAAWLFRPEEISALLQKVGEKITKAGCIEGETVSFHEAVRIGSGYRCTIGDLVRYILEGEIRPCRMGSGSGLNQFDLFKSEIVVLFKNKISREKGSWLTIEDLSKILGIKDEVATSWVEKGLFPCEFKPGKKVQRKIPAEALESFQKEFVLLRDIAKEKGRSPKALSSELMNKGVMPVSGPKVDGTRQYLFRRTDFN